MPAHAQLLNLKFTNLTTKDGLSDNTVVKVVTGKHGFVWAATYSGLNRFDGVHFKQYAVTGKSGSLRSNWVTDIITDGAGTLWVSTEWGLCYYDEATDGFRYINDKAEMLILYKAPLCLQNDTTLWIATETGLKKINTVRKTFTATSLAVLSDPQAIIYDGAGRLWIGTRGRGLYCYHITTDRAEKVTDSRIAALHTMNFYRDGADVWAASSGGLLRLRYGSPIEIMQQPGPGLPPVPVADLMCVTAFAPVTGNRYLLVGSYNKKLFLFDKEARQFVHNWQAGTNSLDEIPYGIFYTLAAAGSILWMGSDQGLTMVNMARQELYSTLIPELTDSTGNPLLIRQMRPDVTNPTQFWLITVKPNGSLLRYDSRRHKIIQRFATPDAGHGYAAFLQTNPQTLFALHEAGLDKFDTRTGLKATYRLPFVPISVCGSGQNLWLGTDKGFAFFNSATGQSTLYPYSFKGTPVENTSFTEALPMMSVAFDGAHTVWGSCIKYGLFSFNTETRQYTAHRQPSGTAYDTRNRSSWVALDNAGNVWESTMAGLTQYNVAAGRFTNYTTTDGLQNDYVYSITIDSAQTVWGRGNKGVFRFNPGTKKFENYNLNLKTASGFYRQTVAAFNGRVYLGFEGGFVAFANNTGPGNTLPAQPVITACRLLNQPYAFNAAALAATPAVFSHNETIFGFDFAAPEFNHPDKLRYAYRLTGFDKTWVPAGSANTATYTNLPPGDYRFEVQATTDGKRWGPPSDPFLFSITPAVWQRLWFWPLLIFLFTGGVSLAAVFRVRSIQTRERQKAALNKTIAGLQMKTLRSQMNPHFIFNSLNSIQKFIWENKKDDASDYLSKFAKLIRMILDFSARPEISLAEEIAALKIYIELEHRRSNGRFEYTIFIDDAIDTQELLVPPLLLQPFVENAIWHGLSPLQNRQGLLVVAIKASPQGIQCSVDDNGIGRGRSAQLKEESSLHRKSVGMNITTERLELLSRSVGLEFSLEITDKSAGIEPGGTTVTIFIPITETVSAHD